jgi:hypothetical protein
MVDRKIPDSARARFECLWRDRDVTYAELLDAFGVKSHNTLYQAARRFDLPPASQIGRKSPPSGLAGLDVMDIRQRYESGEMVKAIARDKKISASQISRMARRNGGSRGGKVSGGPVPPSNSVGKGGAPKIPTGARLDACSSLRRLEPDQIEAVAKSAGQYSKLEKLAQKWGRSRIYLLTCWHEYKAVT